MKAGTDSRIGWLKIAAQASAVLLALTAAGCGTMPTALGDYGPAPGRLELVDTPFYSQRQFQCGPAALMTVLTASGVETTLAAVTAQVYLPTRQGSLQTEIFAAMRASERVPYLLAPGLASITGELAAGRPVLILQNLGISWAPRWHYAVVVGTDLHKQRIVLRSGTDARRIMRTSVFLRTWRRSGFWAVAALKPGELPADPDLVRYSEAVAGLEQTGHSQSARDAWLAGRSHWPNDPVIRFGLANTEYALGNFPAAEALYLDMLHEDSGSLVARNNLAMTLVAMGQRDIALQQIEIALALAGDSPLLADLRDTQQSILETRKAASDKHR